MASGMENTFGKTFKSIGKMAIAAFSVKAIADFMGSCLQLGSDLAEVQNVVDTAFPSMNSQVNEFAKNAMTQFGLSETVTKKYMGTFGAMAKAFKFPEAEAERMSETLTGLAGDVASFYNISSDEAYTKLKSVFTGETETLKDLGVVMTQSALDAYALANGYGKVTAKMTEQEKVALRMAFVTEQLSLASGDFVRTQDSWANQTRILSLRFQSLKASLGKGFIAVFTPIIKGVNWVLANLQVLADSFSSLMEFITGTKSDSGGAALAESVGDLSGTTDAVGDLSSGLDDTGKSAKKAAKEIASLGVDELNIFNPTDTSGDSESSGGSGNDSSGSIADAVDFGEAPKEANVFSGIMQGLIDEFKRLSDIFKIGFRIGLGDSLKNIELIKTSLFSIKDSLIQIFADPAVMRAAKIWVDTLILNFGKITGSIVSIGISIGTFLIASVAQYLKKNISFIQDIIISMFNVSGKFWRIMGNFSLFLANIFSILTGPEALKIGSGLIQTIVNGYMGSVSLISRLGIDILDAIVTPIINNKNKIKKALEGTLEPIATIVDTIAKSINDTFAKVMEVYNAYVAPAFEQIKTSLTEIFGVILEKYNEYIKPVLDSISVDFMAMWQEHVQPAIDSIIEFIGKFVELAGTLIEFISPFIEWLVSVLAPVVAQVIADVWEQIETVVVFISDCIKVVMDVLANICDFLNNVFSGNWEEIWQDIQNFFVGIWEDICQAIDDFINDIVEAITKFAEDVEQGWNELWSGIGNFLKSVWDDICTEVDDSIKTVQSAIDTITEAISKTWNDFWDSLFTWASDTWDDICGLFSSGGQFFDGVVGAIGDIFKAIVNCIIGGINKIVSVPLRVISDALTFIHDIDLPVIGKPFTIVPRGFEIPNIPMLAQGGYVKANQPQLAMIGDNRHQGEIVAPEDKLFNIMMAALHDFTGNSNQQNDSQLLANLLLKIITILEELDLTINLDGEVIYRNQEKIKNRKGLSFSNI